MFTFELQQNAKATTVVRIQTSDFGENVLLLILLLA